MKKAVLSKKVGWIILICLVILDASLDLIFAHGSGLESSIWKPIASLFRINNPLFLTPLVLVLFYFVVKLGAGLTKKADKIKVKSEELVLTSLVLAYFVFDLWLISVYLFGFKLFRNHYYLIPILVVIVLAYSLWAEKQIKGQG